MAFNAGTVEGTLELDANDFVDSLKRARKSLDSLSKQNKRTGSSMLSFSKVLGTVRDAVIVLPALFKAVTAPLRGMVNALKAASGVAAEFQVTTRKLTTALALSGQQGYTEITERLKVFADELQGITGISNTATLGIAQTLTVLGVQQDQLEDATVAVVNYAEAMGRDANMAALQFGRTLSGLIGELGEALPAVRDLTQEQLKAGGAFKVAGELFAGTAEQVAKTTVGLRRSLASAFGDFQRAIGDAINPVLDAITKGLTNAVKGLIDLVRANEGQLRFAFAEIAKGILAAVRKVVDFGLNVPELLARAKAFVFDLVAAFKIGGVDIKLSLLGVIRDLEKELSMALAGFSELPLVGESFKLAAGNMLVATAKTTEQIRVGREELEGMTAGLIEGSKAAEAQAAAAKEAADAIRDGSDGTSAMAVAYNRVNEALELTEQGLNNVNAKSEEIVINTNSAGTAARKLVAFWKGVGVSTDQAKESAAALAKSTAGATSGTAALADQAERAANGFNAAAGAAANMEATVSAGESRRRGGRAGLNLDDPFSAIEAVRGAESALRGAGFSRFSAVASRSARASTNQIIGAAQATVNRTIADFTNGIIAELNRAGVFDEAERQSFIRDRISEAQRFGVLPPSQVSSFAGGL